MRSYSLLLIKTCHRRGVHAMGGMAAQIPIKNNPQANEAALVKVPPSRQLPVRPAVVLVICCAGEAACTDNQRQMQPALAACGRRGWC